MILSISLSLTILFFAGASGVDTDDFQDATGFYEIEALVQGWRQLSDEERLEFKESIDLVTGERSNSSNNNGVTAGHSHVVYPTYPLINLYSYYSNLNYYPTIHWSLSHTPDTNDYWVGIYKVGATDRQYLAWQWVRKNTQGSHYIGKLNTKCGETSTSRYEEFELRLFKGNYQRVTASSNKLYGKVNSAPPKTASYRSSNEDEIDPQMKSFMQSLEKALDSDAEYTLTKENLQSLWFQFSEEKHNLLYPILEQDCIPSHIRKPEYTDDEEWPEPLEVYPDLPDSVPMAAEEEECSICGNRLWITLKSSTTYIYPILDVKKTRPGRWAWVGVYRKRSTLPYPPTGYLRWWWVGPGHKGVFKRGSIKETKNGPISQLYEGPVFDWTSSAYRQTGLGSGNILAEINVT